MDYREFAPPPSLRHLVKAGWTLDVPGRHGDWIDHRATPDGCVEIIRRLEGRSIWGKEQPPAFVAGLCTRPASLRLGGGARFVALRVWPWAWNALAIIPCGDLVDRWEDLERSAPDFAMPSTIEAAMARIAPVALDPDRKAIAEAIQGATTVASLAGRSGRSPRRLQRWFSREIGVSPLYYLRLLRFQETLAGLQKDKESLADHAAARGFADQAHMAREFRSIAHAPANLARKRAKGPFI